MDEDQKNQNLWKKFLNPTFVIENDNDDRTWDELYEENKELRQQVVNLTRSLDVHYQTWEENIEELLHDNNECYEEVYRLQDIILARHKDFEESEKRSIRLLNKFTDILQRLEDILYNDRVQNEKLHSLYEDVYTYVSRQL